MNIQQQHQQRVQVEEFAVTVFGNPDKATTFLTTEHAMLGDRAPLEVAMESEIGLSKVINLLARIAYGAAV